MKILNISHQEYLDDPCEKPSLTRSAICDLLFKSPAHVYHNNKRLNPDYVEEEKESKFDVGTAAHALLLEGEDIVDVVDSPDWRNKEAKKERQDAWDAGRIPVLTKNALQIFDMVKVAKKSIAECKNLGIYSLDGGKAEQTYIWESNGIWVRTKPDWVSNDSKVILDYKTTGELANPDTFARKVISLGYDIQNALYSEGVEKASKVKPDFINMVQENKPPYLCSFIGLPPDFLDMAKQKVKIGKKIWKKCIESGVWEGYPNRVAWIDMPAWAIAAWEYKLMDFE